MHMVCLPVGRFCGLACLFSCHPYSFTNSSQAVRHWEGYDSVEDHRKGPLKEGCFDHPLLVALHTPSTRLRTHDD